MKTLHFATPPLSQRRGCSLWVKLLFPVVAVSALLWPFLQKYFPAAACRYQLSTGTPCFFCGGTRALSLMLRGEFQASLDMHPWVLPGMMFMTGCWLYMGLALKFRKLPVLRGPVK